jgi:hypothetical protein
MRMKKWSWLVAPAIVIALAAMPAHAAKRSGGSSSISIATIDGSAQAAATTSTKPALGDTLTFATNAAGLAGWEYPMVEVGCYQSGALVYMELGKPTAEFLLGGAWSVWETKGGSANCTAKLYAYGWRGGQESVRYLDASVLFDAAG